MYTVIKNGSRIVVKFHNLELRQYRIEGMTYEVGKGKGRRLFVNVSIPWLTWSTHEQQCAEEILEALRVVAKWQGDLQDKQPTLNAHAHKPTIYRNNSLVDQKIRYPIYANTSAPYVQFNRDDSGVRWDVHGQYLSDSLPGVCATFIALRRLATEVKSLKYVDRFGEFAEERE